MEHINFKNEVYVSEILEVYSMIQRAKTVHILNSWFRVSQFNANKNATRYNSMQIFIYCKVTLHVSGVTAPIIRSTKNCNRKLRYRS